MLSSANVPAFLTKLWTLVEDPDTDPLICWSPVHTHARTLLGFNLALLNLIMDKYVAGRYLQFVLFGHSVVKSVTSELNSCYRW